MIQFDVDKDLTLDDSAIIQVYSGEEYIFAMPCNWKELLDLEQAVKRGKQLILDEKDMRAMQKTKPFWDAIRAGPFIDTPKLLRDFRAKKQRKK
jgi:hypothetical protein